MNIEILFQRRLCIKGGRLLVAFLKEVKKEHGACNMTGDTASAYYWLTSDLTTWKYSQARPDGWTEIGVEEARRMVQSIENNYEIY